MQRVVGALARRPQPGSRPRHELAARERAVQVVVGPGRQRGVGHPALGRGWPAAMRPPPAGRPKAPRRRRPRRGAARGRRRAGRPARAPVPPAPRPPRAPRASRARARAATAAPRARRRRRRARPPAAAGLIRSGAPGDYRGLWGASTHGQTRVRMSGPDTPDCEPFVGRSPGWRHAVPAAGHRRRPVAPDRDQDLRLARDLRALPARPRGHGLTPPTARSPDPPACAQAGSPYGY